MSAVVNTRDLILEAVSPRVTQAAGSAALFLTVDTPVFHLTTGGAASPAAVNFTVTLFGLTGVPTFSTSPAVTLSGSGLTRTLAASAMPAGSVTVTASLTLGGVTYSASQVVNTVTDGGTGGVGPAGSPGPTGYSSGIAYLYQFSTVQPAAPTGTSTFTWSSAINTAYSGSDGWGVSVPANPGGPGISLWIASKGVTAPAGTATSSVTYSSGATVAAFAANGATGPAGIKTTIAHAYQWGLTLPTASGSAVYTWATAAYDTPPVTGWSQSKPAAPGGGYTLYEASVSLVDSAGVATSAINWSTASITGISYYGNDGAGSAGSAGNSAAICYTLIDGNSLNVTPLTFTAAAHAFPTIGTWGETRAWTAQPSQPTAGQAVFQSDGIYYPASNQTIWNVPYLSNLKVGNLSAISTNTGSLTVGGTISSANGNFSVDAGGNANMKSVVIRAADGSVILASGTALAAAYAAPGTLNSSIYINSNGVLSNAGGGQVTVAGLDNSIVRSANPITSGNVGTYIANASINNAQIGALDAGKINTGFLSADRINAGTITTGMIVSKSATSLQVAVATAGNSTQSFSVYMDHDGILAALGVIRFTYATDPVNGPVGATFNASLTIDGGYTSSAYVAEQYDEGFVLMTSAQLSQGFHTISLSGNTNLANGNHSFEVQILSSYR